jgi:hypothetical protein
MRKLKVQKFMINLLRLRNLRKILLNSKMTTNFKNQKKNLLKFKKILLLISLRLKIKSRNNSMI